MHRELSGVRDMGPCPHAQGARSRPVFPPSGEPWRGPARMGEGRMTVPPGTRRDMREMGAHGVPGAEMTRRPGVSRDAVARHADRGTCRRGRPWPPRGRTPQPTPMRGGWPRYQGPTSARRAGSATPPGGSAMGSWPSAATAAPTRARAGCMCSNRSRHSGVLTKIRT